MKRILTLLLLLPFFAKAQSSKDEAFQIGGVNEDRILASDLTNNGDLVVGGYFSFKGWVKDSLNSFTSTNKKDIFIVKMKSDGLPIWQKTFGGAGDEYLQDIKTDAENNVYISITFTKSFKIDTFSVNAYTGQNSLVLKLNPQGELLWLKTYESDKDNSAWKLGLDEDNNIFVSGYFSGNYLKADNKTYIPKIVSNYTSYLFKYNANGNLLSGKILGVKGGVWIGALAIKNNEIYLGGYTGTGDAYWNDLKLSKPETTGGIYLIKLNENMELEREEYGRSLIPASINFIHINSDKSIYFSATFRDSLTFLNKTIIAAGKGLAQFGDLDIAVFKLDETGKEIWHYNYGGKNLEEVNATAVDKYENLYVASSFTSKVNIAGKEYTPKEKSEVLLIKFTKDGAIAGIRNSESDFHGSAVAYAVGGILPMDNGDIFVSGWFNSVTEFSNTTLTNRSADDGFIWKISNLATGIQENNKRSISALSVYPNPANGRVNISTTENIAGESIFTVSDICGKTVYSKVVNASAGNIISLELGHLPKGAYFIHCKTANSVSSAKVILQ